MSIFTRVAALERQVAQLYRITGATMADIDQLTTDEQQLDADQAAEDAAIAANSADIKTALALVGTLKAGQTATPDQIAQADAALQRVDAKIKAQTAQLGTDDATLSETSSPSGASGASVQAGVTSQATT